MSEWKQHEGKLTIMSVTYPKMFVDAGDACAVHQDCHGDNLECISLVCTPTTNSTNTDSGRRLSREIGVQTSIDVIETKDVSTSIDKSTILIPQKAPRVQGRQCKMNFQFSIYRFERKTKL